MGLMFCDPKCSCLGEDAKIPTIRVDLTHLKKDDLRNESRSESQASCAPAEAVRIASLPQSDELGPVQPVQPEPESILERLEVDESSQACQAPTHTKGSGGYLECGLSPTADGFRESEEERKVLVAKFLDRYGFKGINVPKRSILSSTYALHKAAEIADQELVTMLLAEGADPRLVNSSGKTAADVAKKKDDCGSHAGVFNLLVDARINSHPKLVVRGTS